MELSYKWIKKHVRMLKIGDIQISMHDFLSKSVFFDSDLEFEDLVNIEMGESSMEFSIFHDSKKVTCFPHVSTTVRNKSWV